MLAVTSVFAPGFASPSHLRFLLIESSFIGLVALGQTVVILGGGIDLSIPWVLNGAATLMTALAAGHDNNLLWVLPLVLAVAALVGLANGVGVALLGVSPIIMTLGMNAVVEGLLLVFVAGSAPTSAPPFVSFLATGQLGPLPIDGLLWAAATVAITIALSWAVFGRRLYAIGTSRVVSQFSAINVRPVEVSTYIISALCAAAAGILITGLIGQAYLGMGDPYLFASVAAVAIGGTSILGGSGHYVGTIAGAMILTILTGLLPLLNLAEGWLQIIYGVTILATVAVATVGSRQTD